MFYLYSATSITVQWRFTDCNYFGSLNQRFLRPARQIDSRKGLGNKIDKINNTISVDYETADWKRY